MSRKPGDTGRWTDSALQSVFAKIVLRLLAVHNTPAKKETWQVHAVKPKPSIRKACEEMAQSGYFMARIERNGSRREVHSWVTHPDKPHEINDHVREWTGKGAVHVPHRTATLEHGTPAEQFRDAYKAALRRLRPRAGETAAARKARARFYHGCLVSLEISIEASAITAKELRACSTRKAKEMKLAAIIAAAPSILDWAIAGLPDEPKNTPSAS